MHDGIRRTALFRAPSHGSYSGPTRHRLVSRRSAAFRSPRPARGRPHRRAGDLHLTFATRQARTARPAGPHAGGLHSRYGRCRRACGRQATRWCFAVGQPPASSLASHMRLVHAPCIGTRSRRLRPCPSPPASPPDCGQAAWRRAAFRATCWCIHQSSATRMVAACGCSRRSGAGSSRSAIRRRPYPPRHHCVPPHPSLRAKRWKALALNRSTRTGQAACAPPGKRAKNRRRSGSRRSFQSP